jgi:hypothetical protein
MSGRCRHSGEFADNLGDPHSNVAKREQYATSPHTFQFPDSIEGDVELDDALHMHVK